MLYKLTTMKPPTISSNTSKLLWNTINSAKDINPHNVPTIMRQNGIEIPSETLIGSLATYFDKKDELMISNCEVENTMEIKKSQHMRNITWEN